MRNNLVTVFHCADCGSALRIADYGAGVKPDESSIGMEPKLETGALISVMRVVIIPCATCKLAYTKPAIDIANALRLLGEIKQ